VTKIYYPWKFSNQWPYKCNFSFRKKKKISWSQVRWVWWIRHQSYIVEGEMLLDLNHGMCWRVVMMEKSIIGCPPLWSYPSL